MNVFVEFLVTLSVSLGISLAIYFALTRSWLPANLHCRIPLLALSSPSTCNRIFYTSLALYLLVFGGLAVLRYLTFNSGTDLGLYDQLVWNSLHGRLFQNTLLEDAYFYLGKSFSPILLAFVPLYAVWSNPITLLVTQTVALTTTVFPIYWFAREHLGYPLALFVTWAFFLSPAVQSINLTDVHGIAFAAPGLAFATYFLFHHRYKPFLVCLGLALLIREEIALIAIIFGAYVFLFERRRAFGLALFFAGCVLAVTLLTIVIPLFHGPAYSSQFYYFGSGITADAQTRYTYLGQSIPEILRTIFTRPGIVLEHVLTWPKMEFVLHLLVPLSFLPLFGFEASLLALPTLGYSLLSEFVYQYSITSFYHAPMLPFLFFGTVLGARRIVDWHPGIKRDERMITAQRRRRKLALGGGLLASALLSYYFAGRGPFALKFEPRFVASNQHTALANQMLAVIPPEAVVAAQTEYVAHLSARQALYEFPGFPDYRGIDYLVADTARPWYGFHQSNWVEILANGFFEVIAENDGVMIARRRAIAQPLAIQFKGELNLIGVTIVPEGVIRGGTVLRPILYWRAGKSIAQDFWVRVRVEDAEGHVWAEEDREPQGGKLPTTRWVIGELIADQFTLNLPSTMPKANYHIIVAVHEDGADKFLGALDLQGEYLGDEAVVASISIEKDKSSVTARELHIEQPLFVDMQEMRFLGYVPLQKIQLNEALHVGLYWRARTKPSGDYTIAVQLRDANGRIAFEESARPAGGTYPTTQWESGEVLLDWHDFKLPKEFVSGDYQIVVLLRDPGRGATLGEVHLPTLSLSP